MKKSLEVQSLVVNSALGNWRCDIRSDQFENTLKRIRAHTHKRAHKLAHTCAHMHAPNTHTRAHKITYTHAHMCAQTRTHTRCLTRARALIYGVNLAP